MANEPVQIIIDTNLWISFLITKDFSKLDLFFQERKVKILFSDELLQEFIEVTQRPKLKRFFGENELKALFQAIGEHLEYVEVKSKVNKCRDPKDDFLLALAQDGNADYLLTGDKDLLVLKSHRKTKILNMAEFFRLLA